MPSILQGAANTTVINMVYIFTVLTITCFKLKFEGKKRKNFRKFLSQNFIQKI